MRSHMRWFLSAILVGLIVCSAQAQLMPLMLPLLDEGVGPPTLLLNKGVQKEIKLSDEQRDKFARIIQDVRVKHQADLRDAMSSPDRKKILGVMRDVMEETREKVNKAVPDILQPEQVRRLKQIEIQVNGVLSLNKPDVQKELKLTGKQKDEVKRIRDGFKQDLGEAIKDVSSLRKIPEIVRKVRELNQEATKKALDTLDEEQKKTWKDMTGERFDFRLEILNMPLRRLGGAPPRR